MPIRLLTSLVFCALCIPTLAFAQSKPPPQAEWDKASADVTGTDKATQTAALEKIKGWVKGGWVSADVWRKWLPALVKAGRHQDVYDLATLALAGRPGPDAVVTLQEARMWGIAYNAAGVNLGASTLPWEVTDEKPTGDNRMYPRQGTRNKNICLTPFTAPPKTDAELNQLLIPSRPAGQYALLLTGKNAADPTAANSPAGTPPQAGAKFMPFYAIPEVNSYRMYFDRLTPPKPLW